MKATRQTLRDYAFLNPSYNLEHQHHSVHGDTIINVGKELTINIAGDGTWHAGELFEQICEQFLRRFFDARFFDKFLDSLSSKELKFLFGEDTAFYYFVSEERGYRQYRLDLSLSLVVSLVDLSVLKEMMNRHDLGKT